jgi:origin recognition complex subunit 5
MNYNQYIAAARWPGFVKPVLDEYERERADEDIDVDMDLDAEEEVEEEKPKPTFILPSEHTRMRLNRLFSSSLLNHSIPVFQTPQIRALSNLNQPEPNLLSKPLAHTQQRPSPVTRTRHSNRDERTPENIQFILVASFLASTNPPKSDIRMFGRGLDEKKRKKRIRRLGGGGDGCIQRKKIFLAVLCNCRLLIFFF